MREREVFQMIPLIRKLKKKKARRGAGSMMQWLSWTLSTLVGLVWCPSMDIHHSPVVMLGQLPTYKIEEDWNRC